MSLNTEDAGDQIMSSDGRLELQRQLDPERFLQKARHDTGLSDFGDDAFLLPMRKLLESASRDVDFHAQGLKVFKSYIERFFKTGPFSWHGIIGWWIPTLSFAIIMTINMVLLHRAAKRDQHESRNEPRAFSDSSVMAS